MKPPSKNTAAGSFVRLPACCFACGGGVVDAMVRWLDGGGAGFVFGGALKSSSWFRVDLSRRNSYHGALLLQVQDLAATTSHLAIWAKCSAINIYRFSIAGYGRYS